MPDSGNNDRINQLISSMMPVDKARLVTGRDHWRTAALPRFNIRSLMMTDGPHGLRLINPDQKHVPFSESTASTCFPPACTTGCSWDISLMIQIGRALAIECKGRADILLGPGINIKRSPLGGRNFEYFSEDPCLAGRLAAAWIEGLQSENIGACVKHFAVNSQESYRKVVNTVVDPRALHEIYLSAFEYVVKKSRPWTLMASYNLVNGVYACENNYLIDQILRRDWKYEGVVISDWGAVNDRVQGLLAGMDLEMPGSGSYHINQLVKMARSNDKVKSALDNSVKRLLRLHNQCDGINQKQASHYQEDHHYLALRAAEQSMVLVKNEHEILPLKLNQRIAVLGDFAENPRYQGHGSSRVNPSRLDSLLSAFNELEVSYKYARAFDQNSDETNEDLLSDALQTAGDSDLVIVCLGLPDREESEGFDRSNMTLPANQLELMQKLWIVQPRIVVVYSGGSPVECPWINRVKAMLISYLGGQASGQAVARLLLGLANPSGKLAESWPQRLDDTPCAASFPGQPRQVEYKESIYVGYRYYQTIEKPVLWPFGFGLSYSLFDWYGLSLDRSSFTEADTVQVTFYVKNIGTVAGAEVAQLYVSPEAPVADRPKQELKAFAKVFLEPGEVRMVTFILNYRDFARYDTNKKSWLADPGTYGILVGSSCQDIRQQSSLVLEETSAGGQIDYSSLKKHSPDIYDRIAAGKLYEDDFDNDRLAVSITDFGRRFNQQQPLSKAIREDEQHLSANLPVNQNTLINDLGDGRRARKIMFELFKQQQEAFGNPDPESLRGRQLIANWQQTPLRSLALMGSRDFDLYRMHALIDILNGRLIRGKGKMLLRKLIDWVDEKSKQKAEGGNGLS